MAKHSRSEVPSWSAALPISMVSAVLIVVGGGGCSGPGRASGVGGIPSDYDPPDYGPGVAVVTICRDPATGAETENYIFSHINDTLARCPELAASVPFRRVDTCEQARQFSAAYDAYALGHSMGCENAPDYSVATFVEEHTSALYQGTIPQSNFPTSPNPIVKIMRMEEISPSKWGKELGSCTGTFIAKNWLITAAHCLSPLKGHPETPTDKDKTWSADLKRLVYHCPPPIGGIDNCCLDGMRNCQWGYAWWKVRWLINTSENPGQPPYWYDPYDPARKAEEQMIAFRAVQIPYTSDPDLDLALIYFPSYELYERFLPPDITMSGSFLAPAGTATDAQLRSGNPSLLTAGWGGQDPLGQADRLAFAHVTFVSGSTGTPVPGEREIQVNIFDGTPNSPVLCPGDSGGPLYWIKMQHPVIAGVVSRAHHSDDVGPYDCILATKDVTYTRLDNADVLRWINTQIATWQNYHESREADPFESRPDKRELCLPRSDDEDVLECWGKPCDGTTADGILTRKCDENEVCVRAGSDFVSNMCPTALCGKPNCDCIVGTCALDPSARPAPSPDGGI